MAEKRIIKHGSLFSGIGGFDLAADWCGWQTVFHCEVNEFCNQVLNYYWPNATAIKSIVGYGWEKWKGKVDVLSGGWPCQKYSVAGKRAGNEPLKEELLRAVFEIKPAWAVLENVGGFITKKFAGEHDLLCKQLEGMGYEVQTFDIDAASCGVPTMERHIWIIASATGERLRGRNAKPVQNISGAPQLLQGVHPGMFDRWSLPKDRVCNVGEGVSQELDTATISAKKWHAESLKALGNAITPQIAYYIFKMIQSSICAVK